MCGWACENFSGRWYTCNTFRFTLTIHTFIVSAAPVSDIRAVAANATAVNVTWSKPELLDWNVSSYTLHYKAFSRDWVVDESSRVIPANTTSIIMVVSELASHFSGVKHQFQVTASLEVHGEVLEGKRANATFIFGKPYAISL